MYLSLYIHIYNIINIHTHTHVIPREPVADSTKVGATSQPSNKQMIYIYIYI